MLDEDILNLNLVFAKFNVTRINVILDTYLEKTYDSDTFEDFQKYADKSIALNLELKLWTSYISKQGKTNAVLEFPSEMDVNNEISSFLFVKSNEDFESFCVFRRNIDSV